MSDPTYRLEGVVRSRDELQDFEGPLSLILQLLSKNRIEIRDIRISEILEQYIEQIGVMREQDLDVASEFVQMASHLVYIKGRMLLSSGEEVSELEELMSSLEKLRNTAAGEAVRRVAPELLRMSERGLMCFSTPGEPLPEFTAYDYRHEGHELLAALAAALSRSAARPDAVVRGRRIVPKRITYPVRVKAAQIMAILRENGDTLFGELCAICEGRSELVATFLSVLELCSAGTLSVFEGERGLTVRILEDNAKEILDAIPQ